MRKTIKDNELFTVSAQWMRSIGVSEDNILSISKRYSKTLYYLTEYTIIEDLSYVIKELCLKDEELIPDDKVFIEYDILEKIIEEIKLNHLTTSANTDMAINEDIQYELKRLLAIRGSRTFENFRGLVMLLEGRAHTIHYTDDNDLVGALEALIVKKQKRNYFHYEDLRKLGKILRNKQEIRSMYISDHAYDMITEDIMEFLNDESIEEVEEFLALTNLIGDALEENKKAKL
ncbi:MAG: hypothetical protein ACRCVH_12095 [Vagococcus fluvialis]